MDYTWRFDSPLGDITLASDGEGLTGLWFDGQKRWGAGLGSERAEARLPVFDQAERWLGVYFSGREPDFAPPLRLRGTPFCRLVWAALQEIPYGQTATYAGIAEKVAARMGVSHMSPQAVGGAVGRNPVSLIVPCHRVVGRDGSLSGYAGGMDRKLRLLKLEGADTTELYVPKRRETEADL